MSVGILNAKRCGGRVQESKFGGMELTVTVVVQVAQLITPLSDDSKRILQKRNNNQKASNRREVSNLRQYSLSHTFYPLSPLIPP